MAYINTNHPDFFGGGSSAIQLIEKLTMNESKKVLDQQQQQEQQQQQSQQQQQQSQQKDGKQTKTQNQPSNTQTKQLTQSEMYNQTSQDRERIESNIIKALLNAYFSIIRKSISDSVPKAIMCFLVNKSKSELQSELVKNLYKEELFNELLRENDDIAAKRKATAKMLEVLTKANQIINEVKDMKT